MSVLARIRSWTKAVLRRPQMEREMDLEFRFHLEARAEELMRTGATQDEARRRAGLEFGGFSLQKEDCRASFGLRLWDEFCGDLRYAFRMLRQSPAFAAIAITSLALGIGANTAIFEMTEAALLKSLPVRDARELRLLSWVAGPNPMIHDVWGNYTPTAAGGHTSTSFSYPVFLQLRDRDTAFRRLVAFKDLNDLTATVDGNPEPVAAQLVTGDFYQELGIQPIVGRGIDPADDQASSLPVAVISDAFWNARFARSAAVIGRKFRLNGTVVTIVGVNPPQFTGTTQGSSPEIFLPMSPQPQVFLPAPSPSDPLASLLTNKDEFWVMITGRLKEGVTSASAQAALDTIFAQALKETLPANRKDSVPRLRLLSGSRGMDQLRERFSKPIYLLMSMAALVLLLACVNLANLLLARATAREREIAIRAALGAKRGRIVRQVLTESMLLAILGGAAGILLGYWCRNLIPSLSHSDWERSWLEGSFDVRVLCFALALCLLTGLLFGLAPAWHATRNNLNAGLKDAKRATDGRSKLLVGKLLVGFQVSLSVLLVIGAGLFVRTLINLRATAIGFEPRNILLFSLEPPRSRYPSAQRVPYFHKVEERVTAIPGVTDLALSKEALLSNSSDTTDFTPDGTQARSGQPKSAWFNAVGTRFFRTMKIPILHGRDFDARDDGRSPAVAVINERLAQEFFPSVNPVGRTFTRAGKHIQIVGVCANAKAGDLRADPPAMYYRPYLQVDDVDSMTFEVKTTVNTGTMAAAIRKVIQSVDRDVPLTNLRSQSEQIDATLIQERLFAGLTSSFGLLALLLASIGIYGIMAYTVARRTNEIGIRMALGARSGQVLASVLRDAAWLTLVGVVVGAGAALALTRFVSNMLYGLKAGDPLTMVVAILLMLIVALLACLAPARRAVGVDPITALRHD